MNEVPGNPTQMRRGPSRNGIRRRWPVAVGALSLLLLGPFLGAVLHVGWADHDHDRCAICTLFPAHGWLVLAAAFAVCVTCARQPTVLGVGPVTRSVSSRRSRSPPR